LGVGKHRLTQRFDLYDLGLLTGPSLKGATIIVELTKRLLHTSAAAFAVFDTIERLAVIRARTLPWQGKLSYPLHSSALVTIEEGEPLIAIKDLSKEMPKTTEGTAMHMHGLIASAVHGPDEKPIGALVAMDKTARKWDTLDLQNVENLAYLITQEVTLRASFATLQLISVQDQPIS
jgi:hypothetical protein